MGTVACWGGRIITTGRCLHEMGNIIDGVGGKICGGISGIMVTNVALEEEEEDGLEVGWGDV